MQNLPLIIFLGVVIAQALAEAWAMHRTGTFRRKHKCEWTCFGIMIPFKAMLLTTLLEQIELKTMPTITMISVGCLIALGGIIIRVICHFELAGAFSGYIDKIDNQRIVKSGLYAKIRHPMYIGSICLFIGIPLILAAKWAWIFSFLGIIGIFIRIHKEEKFLAKELPGYSEYIKNSWRLIPHIY